MNWKLFFSRRTEAPQRAPSVFEEIRLGTQAQVLRDSDAYQRAMQTIRVKLHEAWAASEVEDREGQHELKVALKILDALEGHIKDEADTGLLAKRQHEDEQRKAA